MVMVTDEVALVLWTAYPGAPWTVAKLEKVPFGGALANATTKMPVPPFETVAEYNPNDHVKVVPLTYPQHHGLIR